MFRFLSNTAFRSDGRLYTFNAVACGGITSSQTLSTFSFPQEHLVSCSITNMLNQPCLSATLTYTDVDGSLAWITDNKSTNNNITIAFGEFGIEYDGDISIEDHKKKSNMSHCFLIDRIEKTNAIDDSSKKSQITYTFFLKSMMLKELESTPAYSINAGPPKEIFDIIKESLISRVGIDYVNTDSFSTVKGNVLTSYSSTNNTFFQQFAELYRKMFDIDGSQHSIDGSQHSIKGIYLDEYLNQYCAFDLAQHGLSSNVYFDQFEVGKQNPENVSNSSGPMNIGSIESFPTTQQLELGVNRIFVSYDHIGNKFIYKNASGQVIADMLKQSTSDIKSETTDEPSDSDSQKTRTVYVPDWNNSTNIMRDLFNSICGNNALVINVKGKLGRQVNDMEVISIDKTDEDVTTTTDTDMKEEITKYLGIRGSWIITKVVNKIDFQQSIYRQSLYLMRTVAPSQH